MESKWIRSETEVTYRSQHEVTSKWDGSDLDVKSKLHRSDLYMKPIIGFNYTHNLFWYTTYNLKSDACLVWNLMLECRLRTWRIIEGNIIGRFTSSQFSFHFVFCFSLYFCFTSLCYSLLGLTLSLFPSWNSHNQKILDLKVCAESYI